jgi:hypothetical protein
MIEIIVAVIAIVVVCLLVYVSRKPDEFEIRRAIGIDAPAEKIFPMINDVRSSLSWSAWEKIDPDMQRRFEGPASGIGAKYAWKGNREIGQGELEIALSDINRKVRYRMHFIKPFEGHSDVDFDLSEQGAQTLVTQTMRGKSASFLPKLICTLFFDQDKMIGGKFEEGLAALKALAEA